MQSDHPDTQRSRQAVLEKARNFFGYAPNLITEMAHNVATTEAYLDSLGALQRSGTLTKMEQQVVMLAISARNRCEYCIASHRTAASRYGVATSDLDRICRLKITADRRLQGLTSATWAVMDRHGWLNREDLEAFGELGIEKAQFYEIVALVSVELIANYIDHIEKTPLDAAIIAQRFPPSPEKDA